MGGGGGAVVEKWNMTVQGGNGIKNGLKRLKTPVLSISTVEREKKSQWLGGWLKCTLYTYSLDWKTVVENNCLFHQRFLNNQKEFTQYKI